MFQFSHYHSNVHEALGIYKGTALLQFGGDGNAAVQERVQAGDVLIIPAGVGHKQVQADDGFMMVGAYPQGSPPWDCLEGKGGHSEKQQAESKIQDVPHPGHDPVYGDAVDSPLSQFWKQSDHQQA